MSLESVTCVLGSCFVKVRTDEPGLLDYLGQFYTLSVVPLGRPEWTVDARVGPGGGMPRNKWGVAYQADQVRRRVTIRAADVENLSVTTRKCIREVLLDGCEQLGYTMLHASAFADDDRVVVVVGDKGSGKTTLALRAALEHGFRYISNDHLILYPEDPPPGGPIELDSRLVVTSPPTLIPVKIGTYLDLEARLPAPWDDEGLNIEAFREMSRAERYRHDDRLLYTYRSLGQDNPVTVPLGTVEHGPSLVVVLARYTRPNEAVRPPQVISAPADALVPHIRFDWIFDPDLNQHYLPRVERDPACYSLDSHLLVSALARRARVLRWSHHGDPEPLLSALTTPWNS